MTRAPDWSKEEFEMLINNPGLLDKELASKLPDRTVGAIEVVRNGLHSYHKRGNVSMLSQMMLRCLEKKQGTLTCPRCSLRF